MGRCSGGGATGGEIAPHPPTQMSFDNARSYGHTNSEILLCLEVIHTTEEAVRSDSWYAEG
jgi:hypothetical protein